MKTSSALGQIFLRDKNYLEKILSVIDNQGVFLEIGPGDGALTGELVKKVKFLYCVELDSRLYYLLKKRFSHLSNIDIIHGDILKFPLRKLKEKLTICGNIPYQISNRLIRYFVDHRNYIEKVYFMLQKEFAQKLTARASSRNYSFLSCYIQYYANVENLFDVPHQAFSPQPKVDSSFCKLQFLSQPIDQAEDEEFLFKIIRKAFTQRRKKIANSLAIPKAEYNIFTSLKIDPSFRAENLSLRDYVLLANLLRKGKYRI